MGIVTAPFNWDVGFLPRDPVPVDGHSLIWRKPNKSSLLKGLGTNHPQDVEDQITYPLTTSLLLVLPGS